eukprot:gb/GECH01010366.1/.p1 GENE.gb/GECH01010366.1/~~gb/GECH01010366.1/.p1  ORF type:complete len:386 (+),score=104.47 gb/GECH01010366.1/:1-1158(+)
MLQGDFPVDRDENGAILVDRKPDQFPNILKFLQTKSYLGLIPENITTLQSLLEEAEFYNVSALARKLRQKKRIIQGQKRLKIDIEKNQKENEAKDNDYEEEIKIIQDKVEKIDFEEKYLTRIQNQHKDVQKNSFQVLHHRKQELEKEVVESKSKVKEKASEYHLVDDAENTLITLNLSGKKFVVDLLSLARVKGSLFAQSINSLKPVPKEIYIYRDPEMFHIIVEYLFNGSVSAINIPNTKEQKEKLLQEARYYRLPYFEELFDIYRYPLETIGKKNIKMKQKEDALRRMFVFDRENPALSDPCLNLIPVFFHRKRFDSENDEDLVKNDFFLIYYENERFQAQFNDFTKNMFDGLDWSNIFAAGGSILAFRLEIPADPKKKFGQN